MPYRVKDWHDFQHYKDRNPTWIKLHKSYLDNYEFHCLPVASKALAPMLWLLASENKDPASGIIDGSDEKISFRLRMTVKELLQAIKPLINSGFILVYHDASALLAEGYPNAMPETYREEEEIEDNNKNTGAKKVTLSELSVNHISDWLEKKRAGGIYLNHDENFILEYFKNYCESNNKTYTSYPAALRNAFEWEACQPKPKTNGEIYGGRNGKSKLEIAAEGFQRAAAKREQASAGQAG